MSDDINVRFTGDNSDLEQTVDESERSLERFGQDAVRTGAVAAGGLLAVREAFEEIVASIDRALERIDRVNERTATLGERAAGLGVSPGELQAIEALSGQEAQDVFAIAEGVEGRLRDLSDSDARALRDLGFDRRAFRATGGAERVQFLLDFATGLSADEARGAAGEIFGGDDARRLFEIGARQRALGGVRIGDLAAGLAETGIGVTGVEADEAIRADFERRLESIALLDRQRGTGLVGAAFAALPLGLGGLYESVEQQYVRAGVSPATVNVNVDVNGGRLRADTEEGVALDEIRPTPRSRRRPR